ncbi:hypothetical protein FISHEDRAFT_48500 [Fistulina hepatica ATCC 64428]|uniref:Manganese/iron superoxide dismutase C-terminal domain-containing protein n=1 Tax=Fistulina hepatica ATCC 64428 TaxID=1128425 RepID=A0A0D7A5F6_9AGAR|nr:hypothetical protein FISHEDRAFT_48500 [Fistulina hepatica ATCC 64428]
MNIGVSRTAVAKGLSCVSLRTHARRLHQLKPLSYDIDAGLGRFLPPDALRTVAVEYQSGLISRLNEEIKGTEQERQSLPQIVISTAANKSRVLAFNYASLALNNSFFLEQLSQENSEERMSGELGRRIMDHHGSIAQLKSTFSSAVLGMFGSGYVWFVTDVEGRTAVLPTFGPGTLLIASRTYLGSRPNDSPHGNFLMDDKLHHRDDSQKVDQLYNDYRDQHPSSEMMLNASVTLFPLFCVSVHEHNWLSAGFGVWGKEAWMREFWSVLDWEKVNKQFGRVMTTGTRFVNSPNYKRY